MEASKTNQNKIQLGGDELNKPGESPLVALYVYLVVHTFNY